MREKIMQDVQDAVPITARIKTFEDARRELGESHLLVLQYEFNYNAESGWNDNAFEAYLKLRIICAALNEGWEPQFTRSEKRYYPRFELYTKEELDFLSEEYRRKKFMDLDNFNTQFAGFTYERPGYAPSHIFSANVGSRLCLKNEELASYCGKQFISIWADLILIRKQIYI